MPLKATYDRKKPNQRHGLKNPVTSVSDVTFPGTPSPKEVELSKQLIELRQEKDKLEKKLRTRIATLEYDLHTAEEANAEIKARLHGTRRDQVHVQNNAVMQEREIWLKKLEEVQNALAREKWEKDAQEKWKRRFTSEAASASDTELDVVQGILSRFNQDIALLPTSCAPKAIHSGTVGFLTQIIRDSPNDFVIGSALIALIHLSLHQESAIKVREVIVKGGVLQPLICLIEFKKNPAVLEEATKLMASLALFPANKRVIASRNGVKALHNLLVSKFEKDSAQHEAVTPEVITAIFSALVNLSYGSEVIQTQIVSLGTIPYIVDTINEENGVIDLRVQSTRLLCNLACNHFLNQGKIASSEGDVAALRQLVSPDLSDELIRSSMLVLANLAHNDLNQKAIGYSDAVLIIIKTLVESTSPRVLFASATAFASLVYRCMLNKHRFGVQRGAEALLYVLSEPGRYGGAADVQIACCYAMASFLLGDGCQRIVEGLDGPHLLVRICSGARDAVLIRASAMAVAALVPVDDVKLTKLSEGLPILVEDSGGLAALERAKHSGYRTSHLDVPLWLEEAIRIMKSSPKELTPGTPQDWYGENIQHEKREEMGRQELYERGILSIQEDTEVEPDSTCKDYFYVKKATNK